MIDYVYRVTHVNPKNDDIKGIGTYATRAEAEKTVALYKTYKGFKDSPENFYIQRYQVDQAHWSSGYATKIIPRSKKSIQTNPSIKDPK